MHDSAHDSPTLVSVTECARLLTEVGDRVDRSALSRYCDTHGLKREVAGRSTLVDFEAVRAHRAASYSREVMSGGRQVSAPAAAPVPAKVVDLDPARREKTAKATNAELDLAERLGELASVAEVDAGAADAIAAMRASFAGLLHDEAEQLGADLGTPPERMRVLRAGLKRYARRGQERLARELASALVAANEPTSDAYARLMTLTGHALRLRAAPAEAREARA